MTAQRWSDALLVRRARYGDRRAARLLAARHLERISVLATVVGVTTPRSAQVARDGFRLALRSRSCFDVALVRAFGALAFQAPDREAAQGRLVALLVDLERRPLSSVAGLLGITPAEAAARRETAGSVSGALVGGKSCRGWGLASGRRELSTAERTAGEAHLALCRRCGERRAQLDREHRELLVRAAGVATLIGAADVATLVLAPAGILAGKAAVAAVGALGAAALATGGLAAAGALPFATSPSAVTSPGSSSPGGEPVRGTCGTPCLGPSPAPAPAAPTTSSGRAGTPAPSVRLPSVPVSPVAPRIDVPALPLPLATTLLSPLPTTVPLPLPSSLQLPLPSTSPIPLPTELTLPQLVP